MVIIDTAVDHGHCYAPPTRSSPGGSRAGALKIREHPDVHLRHISPRSSRCRSAKGNLSRRNGKLKMKLKAVVVVILSHEQDPVCAWPGANTENGSKFGWVSVD